MAWVSRSVRLALVPHSLTSFAIARRACSTSTSLHTHSHMLGSESPDSQDKSSSAAPLPHDHLLDHDHPPSSPTYQREVTLEMMLENNSRWAKKMETERPGFFHELARTQHPDVLWIGCADSRVPSNSIVGLLPGEVFTHRNIANVVSHTDLSALSVLQYAVDVLKVKHIVVCGHYGCGGVLAAMTHNSYGLIDNWLRRIKDIYDHNREKIEALPEGKPREDFLIELNVAESISAIVNTTIVQKAWARGQPLDVHGWCYRLEDGRVRDLGLCISDTKEIHDIYKVFKQRDRPHDH